MSERVGFHLRQMSADDRDEVSRLIFHSTNRYYVSIGREPIFKGDELSPSDILDVYQRIDPGEGIVAVDAQSRQIIGSCFVHPRETHVSLGIIKLILITLGVEWHERFSRRSSIALEQPTSLSAWYQVASIWTRIRSTLGPGSFRSRRFRTCSLKFRKAGCFTDRRTT